MLCRRPSTGGGWPLGWFLPSFVYGRIGTSCAPIPSSFPCLEMPAAITVPFRVRALFRASLVSKLPLPWALSERPRIRTICTRRSCVSKDYELRKLLGEQSVEQSDRTKNRIARQWPWSIKTSRGHRRTKSCRGALRQLWDVVRARWMRCRMDRLARTLEKDG